MERFFFLYINNNNNNNNNKKARFITQFADPVTLLKT